MRATGYVCLAIFGFAGAHADAQFFSSDGNNRNNVEFRGRVVEGGFSSYEGLIVEISNLRDRTLREHADVSSEGSFGFREVPEGDYEIKVTNLYGSELTSTIATIGPSSVNFEIRLPQSKVQKPVSGTVSMQQLVHPPSKQVRKLLESGSRLLQDQRFDDAAARFREAAQDDPDCPQAHADLGMALTKLGAWDSAAGEFRAAIALDPRNSVLHSNLSVALAAQKQYEEAQHEASAALKLDPGNPRAHYVLASVLIKTGGSVPAIVSHLLAAQDAFPSAKTAVEQICAHQHVPVCP